MVFYGFRKAFIRCSTAFIMVFYGLYNGSMVFYDLYGFLRPLNFFNKKEIPFFRQRKRR